MRKLLGILILLVQANYVEAQSREQAVSAARDGRVEEGVAALRALIAKGDKSAATAYDLAVVLTWAKRPREATDVFEGVTSADPPEFVLTAMARAYWDQRRYAEAGNLTSQGLARFPADAGWVKLHALIRGEEADRAGDLFTALRFYAAARGQLPDDSDLGSALAGVLARLGAPFAAAEARKQPDAGLQAYQAGLLTRWGPLLRPVEPERRFEATDAALARLDQILAAASDAQPPDAALLARLRRDRVVALRDRERWSEAVAQVEQLRKTGDRPPVYVRQAEADSLLALRRPAEARKAYVEVIEAAPGNTNALIGRFYCEIEVEDFDAAFSTIDKLLAAARPPNAAGPGANREWLGLSITAALVRHYADMHAEAWRRLYPIAEQAPALGYLRAAVGSVAAARGWPRRSAEEIEIASHLAPRDLGIQVALGESELRLRHYAEARESSAKLTALRPSDAAVQRFAREIRNFDRWEFRAEGRSYNESGGGVTQSPGTGYETTARLYSPPISDRWRILGGFDFAAAQPVEGWAHRFRSGGGVEWRRPALTIEATGWANTGTLNRGGARLTGNWAPTDHWNFGADAQIFSTETPLRALIYGITANSIGLSAGYDWHESTGLAASFAAVDFSDGNDRLAGGFRFAQKLIDRPHFELTARPEVYFSRNTRPDAPYFNPSRDFSFSTSLDADHILWRRYERSFRQRVNGSAGLYWQRNYGTGFLAGLTYEQVYRFDPVTEFRYGFSYTRRIYDGDPVNAITFILGIYKRF